MWGCNLLVFNVVQFLSDHHIVSGHVYWFSIFIIMFITAVNIPISSSRYILYTYCGGMNAFSIGQSMKLVLQRKRSAVESAV